MEFVEGYDQPMQNQFEREPLELIPDREWIDAKISDVSYEIDVFNGKTQYITNKKEEFVLDKDGNKIPRKVFNITFTLNDYKLPNGNQRKSWLRLGASLGQNAKLPTFLANLGIEVGPDATPRDIEDMLKGMDVKIQLANRKSKDGSKTFQNVVYDAVKPL